MKRIISMFVIVLLLAACVPTPETEFVTHKDTEEMLEKAAATPVSDVVGYSGGADANGELPEAPHIRERYAIPETLSETVTEADGHFTVNIDARVEVPDVVDIPIIRVEHGTFTQNEITRLFNALTGGRTMYHNSNVMTKSQIADTIAWLENQLNDPALRAELDEEDLANIPETIAELKERWQTAPDELHEEVCDGAIGVMQFEDDGKMYTRYGFKAASCDDQPRLIFHLDIPGQEEINSRRLQDTLLSFFNSRSSLTGGEGDADVHTPRIAIRDPNDPAELAEYPFITYTPAQAMADTEAFFASAGFPEIKSDSIICYPDTKSEQYGYRVKCVRSVAGVKNAYLGMMISGGIAVDSQALAPQWKYERINVCIDKQGVYELSWYAPLGIRETVLPASNLLPFDEIVKRFKSQIWIEHKPWLILDESQVVEEDYPSDMHMEITRISLGLQRVMEKNRFDSGLLVPVWNFYGTTVITRTNVKTRETREEPHYQYMNDSPIISINAIDGSIIDLNKGY
ncbi:MAG: hypothetical protein IKZ44_08965 [Clostridia bacterium]|nr:hypothetical protein [Clostridia bacterium]